MKPLLTSLAGALVLTAASAPAQRQSIHMYGSGGFGLASAYAKLYDPTSVITFSGRITGITVASPMNGVGDSERIVVKAKDGGSSLVELGPQWYVDNQAVKIHLRDHVTVTGSKVILDGRGSVMASRVRKGKRTLVLRDATGRPYWSGVSMAAVTESELRPTPANVPAVIGTSGSSAQPIASNSQVRLQPYNSSNVVFAVPTTINGTITGVSVNNNGQVFATIGLGDNTTQTVYLGPQWYLERQDIPLAVGDVVTINELTPVPNPEHILYAERIADNGTTVVLRDDTGQEMWSPFVPTIVNP